MSPAVAVDANVALKWVLPSDEEPHADKAIGLMEVALRSNDVVLVAPHFHAEVLNVLHRRAVGKGENAQEAAGRALAVMLTFPLVTFFAEGLYPRALGIAQAYRLPSAYDALYVAVAESAGCDLWTDDRRLLRALEGRLPYVRWIGDWPRRPTP